MTTKLAHKHEVNEDIQDHLDFGHSAYLTIGDYEVRVADHVRQKHHSAKYSFNGNDAQVIVLKPSRHHLLDDYCQWRLESPREVYDFVPVLIPRGMKRTKQTELIRRAIALAVRRLRHQ